MFSSFLKNLAIATSDPGMLFDYALYRMGRKSVPSTFGTRLAGATYSELRTIRNLKPGPHEMDLIRSISADGIVFDVGAHVGIWTCAIASAKPRTRVHAFEASPSTFGTLRANVNRNKLQNVILNNVAATDSNGTLEFQLPENASVFGRIRSDGDSRHRFDRANVAVVSAIRLADYCRAEGIQRIDFLKIDVEGAEPRVLRGLLSEVPVGRIWIEVDEVNLADMGESIAELARVVESAGYRFLKQNGSEANIREDREANMLVVPR